MRWIACLIVLAACDDPTAQMNERLNLAADILEISMKKLEEMTVSGKGCPILRTVETERDKFDHQHTFAVVVFDAYKSTASTKFDSLSKRFNAWDQGPRQAAIDACKRCEESTTGWCTIP